MFDLKAPSDNKGLDLILLTWINSNLVSVSNYTHYKMWDEIT